MIDDKLQSGNLCLQNFRTVFVCIGLLEELQVADYASLMFGFGKFVDANEWLIRNDHEE